MRGYSIFLAILSYGLCLRKRTHHLKGTDLDSRMTRVSVWLSLARLYPPQHTTRRLAFILMIIFTIMGIFAVGGGVLGCRGSGWGLQFRYELCFSFQTLGHLSQYEKIAAVIVACKSSFFSKTRLG